MFSWTFLIFIWRPNICHVLCYSIKLPPKILTMVVMFRTSRMLDHAIRCAPVFSEEERPTAGSRPASVFMSLQRTAAAATFSVAAPRLRQRRLLRQSQSRPNSVQPVNTQPITEYCETTKISFNNMIWQLLPARLSDVACFGLDFVAGSQTFEPWSFVSFVSIDKHAG